MNFNIQKGFKGFVKIVTVAMIAASFGVTGCGQNRGQTAGQVGGGVLTPRIAAGAEGFGSFDGGEVAAGFAPDVAALAANVGTGIGGGDNTFASLPPGALLATVGGVAGSISPAPGVLGGGSTSVNAPLSLTQSGGMQPAPQNGGITLGTPAAPVAQPGLVRNVVNAGFDGAGRGPVRTS